MTEGDRRPSILIGMGETAGFGTQLLAGLRAIGVRADFLDLSDDPLGYRHGRGEPAAFAIARRLTQRRRRAGFGRVAWTALQRLAMIGLFGWCVVRYDAFVLRAGDSFFALRDLPLLRLLRKRLIVVFHGSDSRPSYINGAEMLRGMSGHDAVATTRAKRRLVARTERHASEIISHAMAAHLHRRPTVAFLSVGFPRSEAPPRPATGRDREPIVALHAPSRPASKGTELIREAVDGLRREGIPIELQVLTGRPNAEVRRALRDCDFVIDQVATDTPMGALAAEAAAFGKAAVVGSYAWPDLDRVTAPDAMPPVERCRPEELAGAIARLATDPAHRGELGARAARFVEERWAAARVAERVVRLARGETPPEWRFDPADLTYAHGNGMLEPQLRQSIRAVLATHGTAGLCVDDKPELERALVALAADPETPA